MITLNLTQTFYKAEDMSIDDFVFWCDTLTPDILLRLELHLRRIGMIEKANITQVAGVANCGEEYDAVIEL